MRSIFDYAGRYAVLAGISENGESRSARVFIQPVSVKNPQEQGEALPCGVRDERRWLLIAPAEAFAGNTGAAELCRDGECFEILRRELIHGSHWEGLMRLKAGGGNA